MVQVQDVSKKYGEIQALKDINISIPEGICYGLIGPNGSGKSTLIKIISRILKAYDGNVNYDHNNSLGYVPQDISLEENLTARTNLEFFGQIHGLKGKELKKQAEEVLKKVGLFERTNDIVETFSGGMKRRLNIGCALMHNPSLVILDEPTVGVDPQSRRYIFDIVNELKTDGKTVIYVSHYMEEIEKLCDYVAFIDKGTIIEEGKIGELLKRYSESSVYFEAPLSNDSLVKRGFDSEIYQSGVLVKTKDPLTTVNELVELSKEIGFMPNQLSLFKPKLEDIFFQLTGTDLRDQ